MSTPETQAELAELAELAEREPDDPELLRWLSEHPGAQAELELARRVRRLLAELRSAELKVPEGFEQRLLSRINQDVALQNLLDLGLNGVGALLIELIALILGAVPGRPAAAQP